MLITSFTNDFACQGQVRESCGRGDMNDDTKMSSTDTTRFDNANADTIWDPRADWTLDAPGEHRSPSASQGKRGAFAGVSRAGDDGDVDAGD